MTETVFFSGIKVAELFTSRTDNYIHLNWSWPIRISSLYFPEQLAGLLSNEREAILAAIRTWLSEVGYLAKPIVPVDDSEEDETCLMAGCTLRRIKGRYLCRIHFQRNFSDLPQSAMEHFIPAPGSI